jgi:hypothetical protein
MADIKDVHATKEFSRTLKLSGSRINGVVLTSDDNFYSYIEDGVSIIRKFESDLLTADWDALLLGAKLLRYEHVAESFDEFEEAGFEYPTSSGNFFSLTSESIVYYNAMLLRKATLTYPIHYPTIAGGFYAFTNSASVDSFDAAWIAALESENAISLHVARLAIQAVSDVGIDNARIDSVFAIDY